MLASGCLHSVLRAHGLLLTGSPPPISDRAILYVLVDSVSSACAVLLTGSVSVAFVRIVVALSLNLRGEAAHALGSPVTGALGAWIDRAAGRLHGHGPTIPKP